MICLILTITLCSCDFMEDIDMKKLEASTNITDEPDVLQKALKQFRVLSRDDENSVFSPVSLNMALQIHNEDTPNDSIQKYIGQTDYLSYKDRISENGNTIFTYNNVIWANSLIDKTYDEKVKDYVVPVDFSDEGYKKVINDYIAEKTHNFIMNIDLNANASDIDIIMNVAYFKDTWFGRELEIVKNQKFKGVNKTTKVDMLTYNTSVIYENSTCYVVGYPYSNGDTFYLVYPKKKLEDVNLTDIFLTKTTDKYQAKVTFPKFSIENEIDITSKQSDLELSITDSKIKQKTRIEVDEKGTEAAAVTANMRFGKAAIQKKKEKLTLTFDKPFYFFIQDNLNNDTMFIGQVVDL